ncbi:T9SS type A sorting domain-containing protein [Lacinutrix sp.]|uniref:T9SS type A sorting domain-containing protein n=1 Tax=Lacinutrix sp. TaxID=1937692 RepID=UPI0025C36F29|nr:T9SS type A sorting domain-containing protein [Lacinutrix sp.]
MKKITLLLFAFFLTLNMFGQCPALTMATEFNINFSDNDNIPNTFNACSSVYPQTVTTANGSVYGRGSCGQGQLSYSKQSGPGIDPDNFTMDFGFGPCTYVNGQLTTLSNSEFVVSEFEVYPNPVTKGKQLNINFPNESNYNVTIINILGKTVYNREYTNSSNIKINTNAFANGLYMLRLSNNTNTVVKKVVINN